MDAPFDRPLTAEEEEEARRLAMIAERAEARANAAAAAAAQSKAAEVTTGAKFLTKAQRQELALQRLQQQREEQAERTKNAAIAHERFVTGRAAEERRRQQEKQKEDEEREKLRREREENKLSKEHEHEKQMIRDHYLGNVEKKRKIAAKPSEKFQRVFKFEWEADEDTMKNDVNPLYVHRAKINALYGRGYIAGVDLREQRKESNFLSTLSEKRAAEAGGGGGDQYSAAGAAGYGEHGRGRDGDGRDARGSSSSAAAAGADSYARGGSSRGGSSSSSSSSGHVDALRELEAKRARLSRSDGDLLGKHWSEKALSEMTERDWRIFREDFDIRIQGGRNTLPLRFWSEANFPRPIMQAVEDAGYEKPSAIQRQAIPVGLMRRDLIGIAETGSGKTAAFLIPLLTYMLALPKTYIDRVADEGPLALIMAPTRELAQQIDEECIKLARHTSFRTVCVVGGQSIEDQGFTLRRGVDVVIGTPGRIVDCLRNTFMVLNQCNYVVLDEADRMIDMGFEASLVEILENMGGLLKSEDEALASGQEAKAQSGEEIYRVTAMFSATMPPEVERMARQYLRHPVVVKIGDEDSGKNKRIEQIVQFVTDAQKRSKLVEDVRKLSQSDKLIVFVNLKKQADMVGRHLESVGFAAGVLHGGRSQDQREETLELFRSGRIQILVATDVAGRGLDIPDVSHVINYDMSSKIQPYSHRIGRTGRAGKSGVAITYLTEGDTEVMYDLKSYLESTNSVVPQALAKNPAAQAPVGARDDKGKLLSAGRKDSVQYVRD